MPTNPYAPTDAPSGEDLAPSPWILYSQIVLVVCGALYLLIGLLLGVGTLLGAASDPTLDPGEGLALGVGIGGLLFGMLAVVGAVNWLAAWGLRSRAMWAWVLTLVLGATYIGSACFPFGAILLYGMLNERSRKAFLKS
jgi:hypothetical protein